jgi:hypothetical protein
MSITSKLLSIKPTYGTLKLKRDLLHHPAKLLRSICMYKWNVAKSYLESRPTLNTIQAGSHISRWEWWVIRSEFGYLQCTLFDGEIMLVMPFTEEEDDTCYGVIESPVVSPVPITISG